MCNKKSVHVYFKAWKPDLHAKKRRLTHLSYGKIQRVFFFSLVYKTFPAKNDKVSVCMHDRYLHPLPYQSSYLLLRTPFEVEKGPFLRYVLAKMITALYHL